MEAEKKGAGPPARQGLLGRLIGADRAACEVALLAMMVVITVEVVLRSAFRYSLEFTDEVSGYLLVAVTFLSIGISLHEGALFRVDFLYNRFPSGFRLAVDFLYSAFSTVFVIVVDYQIFRLLVSSIRRGMTAPTLLGTPLYLPQLIMPIGMTFVVLLLLADTRQRFRAWRGPRPRPAGSFPS